MDVLKRNLASGLIFVAPLAIAGFVIYYLVSWIGGVPLIAAIDPWYLRAPIVITIFAVTVMGVGYLMRTAAGRYVAESIGVMIGHIPVLRIVYNAASLAIDTAIGETGGQTEPVKFEAWNGLRVTAFATGKTTEDGRVICFFPTAPNITTGYVIEVEEKDLERTGEGIERALIRVLSAGFGDRSAGDAPIAEMNNVERVRNVRLPGSK